MNHPLKTLALSYLLYGVSIFTTVMALLVVVATFTLSQGSTESTAWIAARVTVCAFIVAMGALTWLHDRWRVRGTGGQLLLWGAMLLMVIGAFGVAWAIHIGEVTGDYEYWIMMIDMALVAQGALAIQYLWVGRRNVAAPQARLVGENRVHGGAME